MPTNDDSDDASDSSVDSAKPLKKKASLAQIAEAMADDKTTKILIIKQEVQNLYEIIESIIQGSPIEPIQISPDHSNRKNRRLDSLARLIEKKEVCAAICFDGENLLIANNTGTYADTIAYMSFLKQFIELPNQQQLTTMCQCLQQVAQEVVDQECFQLCFGNNEQYRKFITDIDGMKKRGEELKEDNLLLDKLLTVLKEYQQKRLNEDFLYMAWFQELYDACNNLLNCSKNVNLLEFVSYIIGPYNDMLKILQGLLSNSDTPLDAHIISAIQNNKIRYLNNIHEIHAEVLILNELLLQDKLSLVATESTVGNTALSTPPSQSQPIYLGISKLCCCLCYFTIQATDGLIQSRGTHGALYPVGAWKIPDGLLENQVLYNKFINKIKSTIQILGNGGANHKKGKPRSIASPCPSPRLEEGATVNSAEHTHKPT